MEQAEQLTANGLPTKDFFVGMLTRDIELDDAILDLLDNCLDGIVRTNPSRSKNDENYYAGYKAEITVSKDKFLIRDNCGGIPKETAIHYAFRMGRDKENQPTNDSTSTSLPTVGIYGIGMKRAIFKIGKSANVFTKFGDEKYTVKIPIEWAQSASWDFPIIENDPNNPLTECGTIVEIENINDGIATRWNNLDSFCDSLYKSIQHSYSLILQKGFQIELNNKPIYPLPIELLIDSGTGSSIKPYLFSNTYKDVKVKIAIGFYSPPPSEDDLDQMNENKRTSNEAGITVVCNDRVILYNDKSSLTGWGTAQVPNYHTQFIGIKGIVIFESTNPESLPMTTTKRGIDHSSPLYLTVKDRICEGLKIFTNYTNQWKGQNQAEKKFSSKASKVSITELFNEEKLSTFGIHKRSSAKGKTFTPQLPKPENTKPYKIIRYAKNLESIQILSIFLFDEPDCPPSKVGEECFDRILNQAKENKNE